MKILKVKTENDFTLHIEFENGLTGFFDVKPYLELEAFQPLKESAEFSQVKNGGYFIEWACGADLSADTIEAHFRPVKVAVG